MVCSMEKILLYNSSEYGFVTSALSIDGVAPNALLLNHHIFKKSPLVGDSFIVPLL